MFPFPTILSYFQMDKDMGTYQNNQFEYRPFIELRLFPKMSSSGALFKLILGSKGPFLFGRRSVLTLFLHIRECSKLKANLVACIL